MNEKDETMTPETEENVSETIESIEETVAELKKQISEEETAEETPCTEEEPCGEEPSVEAKAAQIAEKAMDTVAEGVSVIRAKAEEAIASNEDLKRTVDYIKTNAMKAVEAAKNAMDDLSKDEKVQEAGKKANDVLEHAVNTAAEKAKQAADYVKSRLDDEKKAAVKSKLDDAAQFLNESTKKAVIKADEFYNKPEVQEALGKVRETAAEIARKGSEALQNMLKKDNGSEE